MSLKRPKEFKWPVYKFDKKQAAHDLLKDADPGDYTLVDNTYTAANKTKISTLICYVTRPKKADDLQQGYAPIAETRFVYHKAQGWITPQDSELEKYLSAGQIKSPYTHQDLDQLMSTVLKQRNFKHNIGPNDYERAIEPEIQDINQEIKMKKIAGNKQIKFSNYEEIQKLWEELREIITKKSAFSFWESENTENAKIQITQTLMDNKPNVHDDAKELESILINIYKEIYKIIGKLKFQDILNKEIDALLKKSNPELAEKTLNELYPMASIKPLKK